MQIIDVVLLAQLLNAAPICIRNGKPLTVPGANVDINRTEIVVLLVAGRSAARHLHIQLNGVHAQDHMAHVAQHVRCRDDPGKCW